MSFSRRRTAPSTSGAAWSATARGVRCAAAHGGRGVVSAGLRGVDAALGGGLALGALTVVARDDPSAFWLPFAAYVAAQAVVCAHPLCVLSMDASAPRVLAALPALAAAPAAAAAAVGGGGGGRGGGGDHLRIAWRYAAGNGGGGGGVARERVQRAAFVNDFDLRHRGALPRSALVHTQSRLRSPQHVLHEAHLFLQRARSSSSSSSSGVPTIVLTGVSHAHATGDGGGGASSAALARMLARLRALARLHGAVAVAVVARDVPARIQTVVSDARLRLDSFGGRGGEAAGVGREWLGVLTLRKAYREGRASAYGGVGDAWVFKRTRSRYTLERATAAPHAAADNDDDDDDGGGDGSLHF